MGEVKRRIYVEILKGILVLLQISSICADGCGPKMEPDCGLPFEYNPCLPIRRLNGEILQTVPKSMQSFPFPLDDVAQHLLCGLSHCDNNLCNNGWCEETTEGYQCHCSTGFKGIHCDKQLSPKMFVTVPTEGKLFIADLQDELVFTTVPASPEPRAITYDSEESKIYWSDWSQKRVYRADVNGAHRETVIDTNSFDPKSLAIAEKSRNLYIAYHKLDKITSVSIGVDSVTPGYEYDFVVVANPRSLVVDEEQGYLYCAMQKKIARTFLNGTGSIDPVYYDKAINRVNGLTIDLSRCIRRIYFCNTNRRWTFYMDVNMVNASGAHELTDPGSRDLNDIFYFNGVLYWAEWGNQTGIGMMKDYEHANRSYNFQEITRFNDNAPDNMHIAYIEL